MACFLLHIWEQHKSLRTSSVYDISSRSNISCEMSHTEQKLPIDSSESKFTGSKDIKCDQDNKKPREDTLKSVALFFLENCTAHGLPRIAVERSTFRKILWGIIFAGALGYFCYTLQSIISTFLKYEVNVNTMLHSRYVFICTDTWCHHDMKRVSHYWALYY